ncbi:MAG: hypothetical protein WC006_08830 [Bacilli bacterium]
MQKKIFGVYLVLLVMLVLSACNEMNFNFEIYDRSSAGEKITFSLDAGETWKTEDDSLEEFDIWDVKANNEVPGMIFFYATSFEELEKRVEKNKKTPFYSYNYADEESWKSILNTYNEDYFKDNILLFYYKYEPNISKNYVHSVSIKDGILFLNINRFEGMATALSSWLYIVTINKADVEDITTFNVVVRTVAPLQKSITVYPKDKYMRDIYVNGLNKDDFKGLDNLKSVNVWTWNIMIDIKFNETISDDKLNSIVETLKSSENIVSVGFTSKDWIRVTISNKFFDSYKKGTLKLSDILNNEIENSEKYTMEIKNFTPIAIITLEMEKHGKDYAEKMISQLKKLNLKFIDYDELK